MSKSGIAAGLNKGHKTTPMSLPAKRSTYSKGRLSKQNVFVKSVVAEVAGLAPYEKRLIELIRNAGEKRARKFAKKRLGTHKRALKKVEDMNAVIAESKRH